MVRRLLGEVIALLRRAQRRQAILFLRLSGMRLPATKTSSARTIADVKTSSFAPLPHT